jgi:phospholipase C
MKQASRFCLAVLIALTIFLSACGGAGGSRDTTPPPSTQVCPGCTINSVNHIIIMLQENRSFDDYFGQMTVYRQANNVPIVTSNGDGKINDLSTGTYSNQNFQTGQTIASYHTGSVCTEDLTPDWGPDHIETNHSNPSAAGPGSPMDGFVALAYNISQAFGPSVVTDQTGKRAMGYFDDSQLNYYYFMGANFAIGDAFYSPAPTRTAVNRLYEWGATSGGFAHEPTAQIGSTPIVKELDDAGITWKVYVTDPCAGHVPCSQPAFLSYLSFFTYWNDPAVQAHAAPLDDNAKTQVTGGDWSSRSSYMDDLKNGTLPQVAFIETGMFSGRDEHPSNVNQSNNNSVSPVDVQTGAKFVSTVINALMTSSSWKDSVFFLGFDEGGGLFDHVPPLAVPSPDNIAPKDLFPGDPPGDFTITGFRIPNFIVSPWARKNFVSHTPMDFTAYLKFIETRFGLQPLTARDAAMPDMQEFFDWTGEPWKTPPANVPPQITNSVCDFSKE